MNYSNEALKNLLAENGKTLTSNQRQQIAEAQQQAADIVRQQYDRTRPEPAVKKLNPVERFLMAVPAVVRFISDVGNTLTTITQAMIPAALPLLLVLLVVAEAERVRYGVMLFETHDYLGYIVAYILVIGNAFVELAIQHRHQQAGYGEHREYKWSVRLWASQMGYWFGFGDNWQPTHKSPAVRLERLQVTLTAAILFLAIGGSMRDPISQATGNWREGLVSIATQSTLLEMITWLSGLVSAVVIVLLAQIIVAYAYARAIEYQAELSDMKEAATVENAAEIDHWQQQQAQAVAEARQQAEREMLIKLAARLDVFEQPGEPARPKAPSLNGHG
ncbi:MAG: hypothetical protein AAFV33_07740 [Chloroflexota bacterium]